MVEFTRDSRQKIVCTTEQKCKKSATRNKNAIWEKNWTSLIWDTKATEAWKIVKNLRKDVGKRRNVSLIALEQWKSYYRNFCTETRTELKW